MACGGFPKAMYELMESGSISEETFEVYWNWFMRDVAKAGKSEKIAEFVLLGVLKPFIATNTSVPLSLTYNFVLLIIRSAISPRKAI